MRTYSVEIKPEILKLHEIIEIRLGYAIMNQFGVIVTMLVEVAGMKYPSSTIFMSIV